MGFEQEVSENEHLGLAIYRRSIMGFYFNVWLHLVTLVQEIMEHCVHKMSMPLVVGSYGFERRHIEDFIY